MRSSKTLIATLAALMFGAAGPARAIDGCKVLLCLAGPWQGIPACVSEIEQLFRDLWSGDPFPSCSVATGTSYAPGVANAPGAGIASASNTWLAQWIPVPDPNCPAQYLTIAGGNPRAMYGCRYAGMIPVRIGGQLWSTTYWSVGMGSVTELSAYARSFGVVQGAQSNAGLQTYRAAAPAGGGGGD